MKNITHIISAKTIYITGFILLLFTACRKVNTDTEVNLPRNFTPGQINISAGETDVILAWVPSFFTAGKNVSYTIEVSKDLSFTTIDYTQVVDTSTITITDADLDVRQPYYARVKANAFNNTAESGWVVSAEFQITGEQIFYPILDVELKDVSVVLRWKATTGLTKIVVTPDAGGTPISVNLDAADLSNLYKLISGLTAQTAYTAEIYRNNTSKGYISFTTKTTTVFTLTLNPGDDIVTAVANAADGDVIGLNPGVYNAVDGGGVFQNLTVSGKTITIASVSDNPANTKVNYKEITLKGDGAGLTLKGLEFDGAPSSASGQSALYFLNLTGLSSDGQAAVFTDILVENCMVHDMGNTFMRGNRGSSNGAHKINSIRIKNSFVYNSAQINTNYSFFQINKLQFGTLEVLNSTLYSIGRAFVDWDANFTVSPQPVINIEQTTINNMGLANMSYILFDANANDVLITLKNSIVGNSPYPGESVSSLIRATGAQISFENSNYFNLMDGATPTPAPLEIPSNVVLTNNLMIDPGWTAGTTSFTLPAGSPLRTASTTGGPIGDPRWAF